MRLLGLLWLVGLCTLGTQASTHWMVTESGLIQPKLDSPFEMARPYDLLAFLNQETRWDNIINLYHDLAKKQDVINTLWTNLERDTDVAILLAEDENCLNAGSINMLDWYASLLEDGRSKSIPQHEYWTSNPDYGYDSYVPDCKKISSLTFSMFAFEHLEGLIRRENLSIDPELSLPELISPIMTLDQFGYWVANILQLNSSSWLHYNMASLYWRVRGNAPKALECCRRAVHYAPREYKDIAYLSMGTILHRSKMTEDAITVLRAAVDHDPNFSIHHFMLGNAYGVIGDFNSSFKHLETCLELNPTFELALKHKYGILCHANLIQNRDAVQDTLNKLRTELVEYSHRESHWLESQAAFLKTMKLPEDYDFRHVENNCAKMGDLTGLEFRELKKGGDMNSLIQYFLDGPMYNDKWMTEKGVHAVESMYNLQRLIKHIQKHAGMASEFVMQAEQLKTPDPKLLKELGLKITDLRSSDLANEAKLLKGERSSDKKSSQLNQVKSQIEDEHFEFEGGIYLYPPSMKVSRNTEDFDRDPDWPSPKFCKEAAPDFPKNLEAIFPVFLPFENKGIRIKSLLTNKLGVPADVEHDLPWHPPTCPQDKEAAGFTQKRSQKQQLVSEVVDTGYLRQMLLEYVADGDLYIVKHMQDAEIGQRIYAAIQKKLAPKWLLYTLSSLYWRVRGNNANALHCLLTAGRTVQARYKDIVLASLSSLYLEMGYFDEALSAAEEAFRMSLYEPVTNFILGELNMLKKHKNTHMFHMKQVVRVEPNFMYGLGRHLLNGWACTQRQTDTPLETEEYGEGDICAPLEPGVTMVCEKDGTNCHMSNIHCYNSREREGGSLVRMLELKGEDIRSSADHIDDSIFDQFIANMPTDKGDRLGHHHNFEALRQTVDTALQGCGPRGCNHIQPEDLALKEEDCTYQYLQLGYWLHIISFRQLISDSELKLPPEITTITPSSKKVPECRLFSDPSEDFYLERLSRIDVENWEPVLSLMHQFAEMFEYFDYSSLGAKIAKYVDDVNENVNAYICYVYASLPQHPRAWLGALAAGWWCGAGGRGACAARCLAAAAALAPPPRAPLALRALAQLLHMQSRPQDAKDVAYLAFYMSPKSKMEIFLVAVSHAYMEEYEQAVWMYRYSLTFDDKFLPAKACLHATMCLMLFEESAKLKPPKED